MPAWIDDELWNDQDTKTLRMFFDILPSEGGSSTVLNATLKLHIKERTGKYIHVSTLYKSCHVISNLLDTIKTIDVSCSIHQIRRHDMFSRNIWYNNLLCCFV